MGLRKVELNVLKIYEISLVHDVLLKTKSFNTVAALEYRRVVVVSQWVWDIKNIQCSPSIAMSHPASTKQSAV